MAKLTDDSPVLDEVFERLRPTLFALLGGGDVGAFGALTVLSVHAQEVGADVLRNRSTEVLTGVVTNR